MRKDTFIVTLFFSIMMMTVTTVYAQTNAPSSTPTITSISDITSSPYQTITISGSGFGNQSPYSGGSPYIEFNDIGGIDGGHGYTAYHLDISSWTDSQVVITGFSYLYGGTWHPKYGDRVVISIWNAQTGSGPAEYSTTVVADKNTAPTFTLSSPDIHGLSVTVNGNTNCPNRCDHYTIDWNDGNGPVTITNTAGFTHAYSDPGKYVITATIYDVSGLSTSVKITVNLQSPPPPTISNLKATANGLTVTLNGDINPGPGATSITHTTIDWGDGNTTPNGLVSFSHLYSKSGSYTITDTAFDNNGGSGSATVVVNVEAPPAAQSGTGSGGTGTNSGGGSTGTSVTASPIQINVDYDINGFTVTPKGMINDPMAGSKLSITWDWGDGKSSTGWPNTSQGSSYNLAHTYSSAGQYTITVTATDNQGLVNNFVKTINIISTTPSPDFSLAASPLSIQQGTIGTSTITITPLNGFNSPVNLSFDGNPAGLTETISPNPAVSTSTLSLTVSSSMSTGPSTLTITGTSGSITHTATFLLQVTPSLQNSGNQTNSGSSNDFWGSTLGVTIIGVIIAAIIGGAISIILYKRANKKVEDAVGKSEEKLVHEIKEVKEKLDHVTRNNENESEDHYPDDQYDR